MELKPVGLFAEMSDGDLKKLGKQMREVRHPKGAKPVLRGKDGVGFMVILEGQAEVSTVDGRHRLLGPGDHFGEMALLDQQGRSADITVRTDMVAAAMAEWSCWAARPAWASRAWCASWRVAPSVWAASSCRARAARPSFRCRTSRSSRGLATT